MTAINGVASIDMDADGLPNPNNPDAPEFWGIYELMKQGVVLVTSTGNAGEGKLGRLNTEPAVCSEYLGIVSVGATHSDGVVTGYTQYKPVEPWMKSEVVAWAAGDGYTCADHTGICNTRPVQGTSPAAATIAGLVAYYLGRPEHRNAITAIAQSMGGLGDWNNAVKKYVSDMSKVKDKAPKIGVKKPMVWNGEYPVNDRGIQFCTKTPAGSSGQSGVSGSGGQGRPPKRDSCPVCNISLASLALRRH